MKGTDLLPLPLFRKPPVYYHRLEEIPFFLCPLRDDGEPLLATVQFPVLHAGNKSVCPLLSGNIFVWVFWNLFSSLFWSGQEGTFRLSPSRKRLGSLSRRVGISHPFPINASNFVYQIVAFDFKVKTWWIDSCYSLWMASLP